MSAVVWTEERLDALRVACSEGLSASKIAARVSREFSLSITRNGIIGASHRYGIALGPRKRCSRPASVADGAPHKAAVAKALRVPRKPVLASPPVQKAASATQQPMPPVDVPEIVDRATLKRRWDALVADAPGPRVSLLGARHDQCRLPIEGLYQKPSPQIVCGAPVKEGSSYCPACHGRMYSGTAALPRLPRGLASYARAQERSPDPVDAQIGMS